MSTDPKRMALSYIEACGRKDLDTVKTLLSPDVHFEGPGNQVTGADAYLAILKRLGPVWDRSEVRHAFVDGDQVCVIYDFCTPTGAGKVSIVEWLEIAEARIARVRIFFDRLAFKPASDELARRAASSA